MIMENFANTSSTKECQAFSQLAADAYSFDVSTLNNFDYNWQDGTNFLLPDFSIDMGAAPGENPCGDTSAFPGGDAWGQVPDDCSDIAYNDLMDARNIGEIPYEFINDSNLQSAVLQANTGSYTDATTQQLSASDPTLANAIQIAHGMVDNAQAVMEASAYALNDKDMVSAFEVQQTVLTAAGDHHAWDEPVSTLNYEILPPDRMQALSNDESGIGSDWLDWNSFDGDWSGFDAYGGESFST